jgi:hypothetical protein
MKTKVTIKTVNTYIKEYGYVLRKGKGYYYFTPIAEETPLLRDSMVMVMNLNQLNLMQWQMELLEKIQDL